MIRIKRAMVVNQDNGSSEKMGWRIYLNNKKFVDISDEMIIELNGPEKGQQLILDLEKELLHQFNLN
jgi:hypothetical protein